MRGSELSALVAKPKLDDFLGGISFSEQQQHNGGMGGAVGVIPSSAAAGCYASSGSSVGYLYPPSSASLQFADSVMVATSSPVVHDGVSGGMMSAAPASGGNGGIRLSMIKNWLREVDAAAHHGAHALSLSMNMAGTTEQGGAGGGMALLAGAGERGRVHCK